MSKALLVLGNLIISCIFSEFVFSNFAGSVHACFPVTSDLMKLLRDSVVVHQLISLCLDHKNICCRHSVDYCAAYCVSEVEPG